MYTTLWYTVQYMKHVLQSCDLQPDLFSGTALLMSPILDNKQKDCHNRHTMASPYTTSRRSVIYQLPIQQFNQLLDVHGLRQTWYAVLAAHIQQSERGDVQYMLRDAFFADVVPLSCDFLRGLSIGEISVLYEYSLAYVDTQQRKSAGQYFTPDDVAKLMAERARKFPKNGVWIDPCSGVGNLSYWLISLMDDSEQFLATRMFFVDKDALALFIARCICTMHFQKNDGDLFNTIAPRFIVADFLDETATLPAYDFAILNPPYVVVHKDERFESAGARDLYAYFLERVAKTTKGFVSITPQAFTNGQKFLSLREVLLRECAHMDVYCFDNVPDAMFRGIKFGSQNTNTVNSTRAGIIVAQKNRAAQKRFRITPLLRWRTHERDLFFHNIDTFLTDNTPSAVLFPKVHRDLAALYRTVCAYPNTLGDMLSKEKTAYELVIPSMPRYFISALKTPVSRSSMRRVYFKSEHERNIAYILLNSSYMYWWWRVCDGGMTISEYTLRSLPVDTTLVPAAHLVDMLEQSELLHKVVKKNAGKANENVKHPMSVVRTLNEYLFPSHSIFLEHVHHNSHMAQISRVTSQQDDASHNTHHAYYTKYQTVLQ
jgi:hypothetical protein